MHEYVKKALVTISDFGRYCCGTCPRSRFERSRFAADASACPEASDMEDSRLAIR